LLAAYPRHGWSCDAREWRIGDLIPAQAADGTGSPARSSGRGLVGFFGCLTCHVLSLHRAEQEDNKGKPNNECPKGAMSTELPLQTYCSRAKAKQMQMLLKLVSDSASSVAVLGSDRGPADPLRTPAGNKFCSGLHSRKMLAKRFL